MVRKFVLITLIVNLVFSLYGISVTLADNAISVSVAISYPCTDNQDECDTGEAVSRDVDGDEVNVYITLLDATGNLATAGPTGESLNTLTATMSSILGDIYPNGFLADAKIISFDGDPTARASIDYTRATPGVDQIIVSVSAIPVPLVGYVEVNVVAPPAVMLVARTLRSLAPPQNIYDDIPDPQDNRDAPEPAGFAIPVTIIADAGNDQYTPDPALEEKQVTVKAYADYDVDGVAGSDILAAGYEKGPVGEATFSFQAGIASGTVVIERAGPDGLMIVFTAEMDLGNGVILSTTLMSNSGVDLSDWTVDTVEMNPTITDALLIGSDPYGNGTLVMEKDCLAVLDDNTTPVATKIILTDMLGNAVRAANDIGIIGDFGAGSTMEDQLTLSCDNDMIDSGDYSEDCVIQDTNPAVPGSVVKGLLMVSDTELASDQVTIDLLPASGPGTLDMTVSSDQAGEQINAGDEVILTLESAGDYLPVVSGDILEITARNLVFGEMQLLSSRDFASATTTLTVPANDEDDETDGMQLALRIYGPCSTYPDQNVKFTVKDITRCDVSADSDNINDIEPGHPNKLAIVELADDVETDSELDNGEFVGTNPIVISTSFIADGVTENPLLNGTDSCDAQIWDAFANVIDDEPTLACISNTGFGLVSVNTCDVSAVYIGAAVGTTDTITCEADDEDYAALDPRHFSIPNMIAEPVDDEATAIIINQEGPQDQDGNLIPPCGEAIVRIYINGPLPASKNVEITFGEGSVAGTELRALGSNSPLPIPFPFTLNDGQVNRYVVYTPSAGQVIINAIDLGSAPLDSAELQLEYCQPPCSTDCEGNFDGDDDQDGSDAVTFKVDFGRGQYDNPCTGSSPCNGDFDCDNDCDGSDAVTFKDDFGRNSYGNPCPNCVTDPWCIYP